MAKPGYDHLFKLLMVGDSGVGKTSLMFRFTDDVFSTGTKSTIGIEFKIKTVEVDGKKIKLQIWDTAGQERYRTISSAYYRGAHGVMLVFDTTNPKTFENISVWLREISELAPQDVETMILGNKCDLTDRRQVLKDRGETIAKNNTSRYYETSAKTDTNVKHAFTNLVQAILYKKDSNQKKNNTAKPEAVKKRNPGDKATEGHSTLEYSDQVDITVPEGVAKLSVRDTLPEAVEKLCSACQHNGTEREATHKCVKCQEMLCESCKGLHQSFRQFRDHKFEPIK